MALESFQVAGPAVSNSQVSRACHPPRHHPTPGLDQRTFQYQPDGRTGGRAECFLRENT
ncbi:hypothetical protein Ae505Ps2_6249 [Pseudonocardia sp. Ae505_Ps2]|nr:hypothetical protein Ae505Ps2_6249 [Pseudonocardia sp. Ae505_Ps2]